MAIEIIAVQTIKPNLTMRSAKKTSTSIRTAFGTRASERVPQLQIELQSASLKSERLGTIAPHHNRINFYILSSAGKHPHNTSHTMNKCNVITFRV